MSLDAIQPKYESEYLPLSFNKNCETLIKQTNRKAEETLDFKISNSKEFFSFTPPLILSHDSSWMIRLPSLELYNSIFDLTEENNKFELYTDDFVDEFSYNELKDKGAEVLSLSYISPEDLQHAVKGPYIIKTYRKLSIDRSQTDGYHIRILRYAKSPFRDFESYPRILTVLDGDDIQSIIKQFNSKIIIHKNSSGFYTFQDLAQVLSRGWKTEFEIGKLRPNHIQDKSDSIIICTDNISLKTKWFVKYENRVLRFDEKSFFSTISGFSPFWDYKTDSDYFSEKTEI